MIRLVNYLTLATFAVLVFSSTAGAISKRRSGLSLSHRTQLEFRLGVRDDRHSGDRYFYEIDGVLTPIKSNDAVVSFGINHWTDETTAVNLTVKALASDFDEGVDILDVYDVDYSVVPIFIGVRKYLGHPRAVSSVRPYVALSAGPVIGTERITLIGFPNIDDTQTYATAGAYFGGGIDFLAGRHLMFGFNAGYNLIGDFDEPVGGHVNYSGAEFGVGFGFVF